MIKVENVSMKFRMTNDNMSSLKEFAIAALKHKINYNDFWVFKNINFEVKKVKSLELLEEMVLVNLQY